MSDMRLNASRARKDFFSILQNVYSHRNSFVIEKSGIPMAKIIPLVKKNDEEEGVVSLAGSWKNTELDDDALWKDVTKKISRKVSVDL